MGVTVERHTAIADVEFATRLGQGARIADGVDIDRTGFARRRGRPAEGNGDTGGNDDVGDVGKIGHCPACPVRRIEPVTRRAADPGHRIEPGDAGGRVRRIGLQHVVACVRAGQRDARDRHGFVRAHVLVGEAGRCQCQTDRITRDDTRRLADHVCIRMAIIDLVISHIGRRDFLACDSSV